MPKQILLALLNPRPGEAKMELGRRKELYKSFFGYKLHDCMDDKFCLIRRIKVTAANVHDSQVDLAEEGEVRYVDKGYFGARTKGYDGAMKKATRGRPLSYKDEMRNRRTSKKRSPIERFYAFIKRVCKAKHSRMRMQACVEYICTLSTRNSLEY